MNPYDDDRYQEWFDEFGKLISEFLNTEGNTLGSLRAEFETAIENVEVDGKGNANASLPHPLEEKPGQ